ncbi:MAG: hypothetical protein ACK5FE_16205 [Cyanobacteriota bacterium]|jgi:hypothetical protein
MDSRRLVVWISSAVLGFQGVTLAVDLLNCTVLSWVYVQRHGVLSPRAAGGVGGATPPLAVSGTGEGAAGATDAASASEQASAPAADQPFDPMGLFCKRPQTRIDAAVDQALSVLAGLALGGSLGVTGKDKP